MFQNSLAVMTMWASRKGHDTKEEASQQKHISILLSMLQYIASNVGPALIRERMSMLEVPIKEFLSNPDCTTTRKDYITIVVQETLKQHFAAFENCDVQVPVHKYTDVLKKTKPPHNHGPASN